MEYSTVKRGREREIQWLFEVVHIQPQLKDAKTPSIFLCKYQFNYLLIKDGAFEMWCWRRMEKISWTDHVRNEDMLLTVNEKRNILHEIRKMKANWIGHTLRRNCLLKQVIEG